MWILEVTSLRGVWPDQSLSFPTYLNAARKADYYKDRGLIVRLFYQHQFSFMGAAA